MVTTRSGRKTDGRPTDNLSPIARALRDKLSEEECLTALHATPVSQWSKARFPLSCLDYTTVVAEIDREFPPKPMSKRWCGTCG